jgi:purine-binding chemotaxis protein CheW
MSTPGTLPPHDPAAVLRARALALARREEPAVAGERLELLEFRLARDRYAVETRHVSEVIPLADLTPVPCTPAFLAGVVNVRGRITAVMDIQKFLALPMQGLADLHHIILVRAPQFDIGLLADAIVSVRSQPRGDLQPSLPPPAGMPPDYVKGMTADRVVVLDLERMLADPRLIVHEDVNP